MEGFWWKLKRRIVIAFIVAIAAAGCSKLKAEEPASIPSDFTGKQFQMDSIQLDVQTSTITVGMIGDILLHNPLYTYTSYDKSFEDVRDDMQGIDFLLANQESLPGGVELGISGYPRFNSPKHIIRDVKRNGVDLINMANNHVLDQGESGLRKAIGHMKEYDMPYIGAYETPEDRERARIVDIDGVRLGVLAYTTGTNGLPIQKGKDYMVSLADPEMIGREIAEMRGRVDCLIVSMHWGTEYELAPSAEQEELARVAAEAGADIVFGHHPHVLQPYDKIGETHVFYSLGNFFSGQQFDKTNIGGIATVQVTKTEMTGRQAIKTEKPSFYPTAVVRDAKRRFVVVPLEKAGPGAAQNSAWVQEQIGLPE